MDNIKHITINTRHNRIIHPEDVASDMYLYLKGMVKDALTPNGVDLNG